MTQAQATMRRIGLELIAERKSEVLAEQAGVAADVKVSGGEDTLLGRDLLSVLSKLQRTPLLPSLTTQH